VAPHPQPQVLKQLPLGGIHHIEVPHQQIDMQPGILPYQLAKEVAEPRGPWVAPESLMAVKVPSKNEDRVIGLFAGLAKRAKVGGRINRNGDSVGLLQPPAGLAGA